MFLINCGHLQLHQEDKSYASSLLLASALVVLTTTDALPSDVKAYVSSLAK